MKIKQYDNINCGAACLVSRAKHLWSQKILVVLYFVSGQLFAQQDTVIQGIVVDQENHQPIPFAHFQSPQGGFISNQEGRFALTVNDSIDSLQVFISAIGFASKQVTLSSAIKNTVRLQPEDVHLDEVVLAYEDPAIGLIKKVIENLPKNYPNTFEQLHGEINENTYWDAQKTKPIYAFNAKIRADKFSYAQKNTTGNIELLEKKVVLNDLDSLGIRFYGGGHMVHHLDFVMGRKNMLSKNKIKQFELAITDTLGYNNYTVAALQFKNKAIKGTAYIDLQSHALVRVERTIDPAELKNPLGFLQPYQRIYVHEIIDYAKHVDGQWRINFIHYRTGFKHQKAQKEIHIDDTFILEKAERGTAVIPVGDRVLYSDILLHKIDLDLQSSSNKKERLFRVLSRFRFLTSFSVIPLGINEHQLYSPALGINKNQTERKDQVLAVHFQYDYRVKNNWGIRFSNGSSLQNKRFENYALGGWKEKDLNLNGKWNYEWSTSLEYRKLRINHGGIELDETIRYKNKQFDSGRIDYFSEQRDFGWSTQINLNYRFNQKATVGVYLNYFFPLIRQQGLFVTERNEFWFWNRANVFVKNTVESTHERHIDNALQCGIRLTAFF